MTIKKRNRVCLSLDEDTKKLLDRFTFFTGASTSSYIVKLIEDAKPEINFIVEKFVERRNEESEHEAMLLAQERYYNDQKLLDSIIEKEKPQLELIKTKKKKVRRTTKKKSGVKK